MSSDDLRHLNGLLLLVGALALLRQFYWQVRISREGNMDHQRWAAMGVVFMTCVVMLQYGLATTQIAPPLAAGMRGLFTFVPWITSIFWWTIATEGHNREALKQKQRSQNGHPGGSSVSMKNEDPATKREGGA